MNLNNLPTKDVFLSVGKLASKLRATTTTLHSTKTLNVYRFLSIFDNFLSKLKSHDINKKIVKTYL
jgi:hypothetical protein